nr:leucine-rich repeat protein [Lachnospiraceae bacterium]
NMSRMFENCSTITSLDLSSFDGSSLSSIPRDMFSGCSNLTTIYATSAFDLSGDNTGTTMFYGCSKLVGGNGTTWNQNAVGNGYARIDGGSGAPGYFTQK